MTKVFLILMFVTTDMTTNGLGMHGGGMGGGIEVEGPFATVAECEAIGEAAVNLASTSAKVYRETSSATFTCTTVGGDE